MKSAEIRVTWSYGPGNQGTEMVMPNTRKDDSWGGFPEPVNDKRIFSFYGPGVLVATMCEELSQIDRESSPDTFEVG